MAKKRKQEPEPKAESTAEEDSSNSSDESSVGSDTAAEIASKLTNANDDALSSESEDDEQPTSVQPPPVPAQSTATTASSIKSDGRYHNKQRLLVLSSRGITARYRHLLEDLRTLIPHSKKESKLDVGKFCFCCTLYIYEYFVTRFMFLIFT